MNDKKIIREELLERFKNAREQGFVVKKITPEHPYPYKITIKLKTH